MGHECALLAQQRIAGTVSQHKVQAGMKKQHADRGAAMRSQPVAKLLVDLAWIKSPTEEKLSTTYLSNRTLNRHHRVWRRCQVPPVYKHA
jgi:hypothetical protein